MPTLSSLQNNLFKPIGEGRLNSETSSVSSGVDNFRQQRQEMHNLMFASRLVRTEESLSKRELFSNQHPIFALYRDDPEEYKKQSEAYLKQQELALNEMSGEYAVKNEETGEIDLVATLAKEAEVLQALYDSDGDGVVSIDEAKGLIRSKTADVDNDGILSAEESLGWKMDADADKDGTVSHIEKRDSAVKTISDPETAKADVSKEVESIKANISANISAIVDA